MEVIPDLQMGCLYFVDFFDKKCHQGARNLYTNCSGMIGGYMIVGLEQAWENGERSSGMRFIGF
jgi:hypothetical protein